VSPPRDFASTRAVRRVSRLVSPRIKAENPRRRSNSNSISISISISRYENFDSRRLPFDRSAILLLLLPLIGRNASAYRFHFPLNHNLRVRFSPSASVLPVPRLRPAEQRQKIRRIPRSSQTGAGVTSLYATTHSPPYALAVTRVSRSCTSPPCLGETRPRSVFLQ